MRTCYRYRVFFLLALACIAGCTRHVPPKEVSVGVDPTWFPLQLTQRRGNVMAFSTELLKEIGALENISFTKVRMNWDNLIWGLHNGRYTAILSSMAPYPFKQKTFAFSERYLPTGPVLLMRVASPFHGIDKLDGKEIATLPGTGGELILEKTPGILIRPFDSVPEALNAVALGMIDGAVVDVLTAAAYCNNLYNGKLKIATPPLNDNGLRCIALREHEEIVEAFNRGLNKLKASGGLERLQKKWQLYETCPD